MRTAVCLHPSTSLLSRDRSSHQTAVLKPHRYCCLRPLIAPPAETAALSSLFHTHPTCSPCRVHSPCLSELRKAAADVPRPPYTSANSYSHCCMRAAVTSTTPFHSMYWAISGHLVAITWRQPNNIPQPLLPVHPPAPFPSLSHTHKLLLTCQPPSMLRMKVDCESHCCPHTDSSPRPPPPPQPCPPPFRPSPSYAPQARLLCANLSASLNNAHEA